MKQAYPIILHHSGKAGYYVEIPDFEIGTQGMTIEEGIEMAYDAIGLLGITLQDEGKVIPMPGVAPRYAEKNEITLVVEIDFDEYRRENEKVQN